MLICGRQHWVTNTILPQGRALRQDEPDGTYFAMTDRLSLRRAVVFRLREEAGVSR
jgi:hypothetical protein